MHSVYGRRFVVVGPGVHALNAETLVNFKQFDGGKVQFLFGRGFRDGPIKVILSDEIGQTDTRDIVEIVFVRIIDAATGGVLPPETLERRYHKVEIALDTPEPFFDILTV